MNAPTIVAASLALLISCSTTFAQHPCCETAIPVTPVTYAVSQVAYEAPINYEIPAAPVYYAAPRLNNGIIDTPLERMMFPNRVGVQWRSAGTSSRPRLNNGIIDTTFERMLFPNRVGVRWR